MPEPKLNLHDCLFHYLIWRSLCYWDRMNTATAICAVNWLRGCRSKIGFGGARCFFTTKRDNGSNLQYHWATGYANVNLKSCFRASLISILRRPGIASVSPNWIQTRNFSVVRKSQPEKSLAKASKSKGSRKKLDEKTKSNEELRKTSSTLNQPLGNSSKSTWSSKEVGAAGSNKDLLQASSQLEKPLAKATKSKRTKKKLDETESNEKLLISSSSLNKLARNSSISTRSRKKADAADSNEDLLQASSQPEGRLAKANKSKRTRKKLDETESNEDLVIVPSPPNNPLGNSSKSRRSRQQPGAADSNEDLLQASSQLEEPLAKTTKSKRNRKKLVETKSNKAKDSLEASSLVETCEKSTKSRRSKKIIVTASNKVAEIPLKKITRSRKAAKKLDTTDSADKVFYQLEFDGASKGNPGKAGAGALLRNQDGKVVYELREGVGNATCNVAEYRAVIRGLKGALSQGISRIRVKGDSKLVCSQIGGLWKVKNANLANLYEEAKELKAKFKEFRITHIYRELNSDADALANAAINLQDGEWISSKVGLQDSSEASSFVESLEISAKLTSSNETGLTDCNKDLFKVSEKPLEVISESKNVKKKLDRRESDEVSEKTTEKITKSKNSRKKLDATDSDKVEEKTVENITKSKNSRKKLDVTDSDEVSEKTIENITKSKNSRKKLVATDSDEVSEKTIENITKARNSRENPDATDSDEVFYQLEFDGASKGNPGRAGAGALLRNQNGKVVYKLREGVGSQSNNVAEYRAVILGLKGALSQGISRIYVQGDSKLVCMQVQGLWKTKNENMEKLCAEVKQLITEFKTFQIRHVDRKFNSDADALANAAVKLQDGELISSKVGAKGHAASQTNTIIKEN